MEENPEGVAVRPLATPKPKGAQYLQSGRAGCGFLHRAELPIESSLRRKPTPGNPRREPQRSGLGRRRRPPLVFSAGPRSPCVLDFVAALQKRRRWCARRVCQKAGVGGVALALESTTIASESVETVGGVRNVVLHTELKRGSLLRSLIFDQAGSPDHCTRWRPRRWREVLDRCCQRL